MLYLEYLSLSTALFFQPEKAIDSMFFRYRDDLFKYGLITFVISSICYSNALILLDPAITGLSFTQLLTRVLWSVLLVLTFSFFHIAIISLLLGMFKKKVHLHSMAGLFLGTEFPLVILLPLALIFKAVPGLSPSFFYFLVFLIVVFIFYLKIKALIRTVSIKGVNALALMFLPFIILASLLTFSLIVLFSMF